MGAVDEDGSGEVARSLAVVLRAPVGGAGWLLRKGEACEEGGGEVGIGMESIVERSGEGIAGEGGMGGEWLVGCECGCGRGDIPAVVDAGESTIAGEEKGRDGGVVGSEMSAAWWEVDYEWIGRCREGFGVVETVGVSRAWWDVA
jgi:hypothetical protein